MTWPFPIEWTSADWRAVVQNLVASLVVIFIGDLAVRGILSVVGGPNPRLDMDAAPQENLADVDWPHIRVRNVGLLLSPRTRAANGVIAYGAVDGSDIRFNWSSSAPSPPEKTDIYGDGFADLPIVIRLNRGAGPPGAFYGNLILPKIAYLTEVEFLTQGTKVPSKIGTRPLTDAVHDLVLTTQSLDGAKGKTRFKVDIPPWPGRISIHRA